MPPRSALVLASVLVTAAISASGCGARSGLAGLAVDDASIDVAVVADAADDTSIVTDSSVVVDAGRPDVGASTCASLDDALMAKIVPAVGSCTVVVRIAEPSFTITGYRFFCGPYGSVDEATARKTSLADTGLGSGCFPSASISGSTAKDEYVFWSPASAAACACCGDGSFTAVSSRNGRTLLGGVITFGDGKGLVYPASFDPPSDLGSGCASALPIPSTRGFDLGVMGGPGTPGATLDAATLTSAMKLVWDTALPEALARKAYFLDAMVLRYAPVVAPSATSELFVLVNTGYLE